MGANLLKGKSLIREKVLTPVNYRSDKEYRAKSPAVGRFTSGGSTADDSPAIDLTSLADSGPASIDKSQKSSFLDTGSDHSRPLS